jgi:hypothetical protein
MKNLTVRRLVVGAILVLLALVPEGSVGQAGRACNRKSNW